MRRSYYRSSRRRGRRASRLIPVVVVLLLLAALAVGGFFWFRRYRTAPEENVPKIPTVQTLTLEQPEMQVSVTADASGIYQVILKDSDGTENTVTLATEIQPLLKACNGPVLGCQNAFYLLFPDKQTNNNFYFIRFYGVTKAGELRVLAESFGSDEEDFYATGTDGNGYPILAVNLTYAADGGQGAYLYRAIGDTSISRIQLTDGRFHIGEFDALYFRTNDGDSIHLSDLSGESETFLTHPDIEDESYLRACLTAPDGSGVFLADESGVPVSEVYDALPDFSLWRTILLYQSEQKYGYLDAHTGKEITPAIYESASSHIDGTMLVSEDGDTYYYLTDDGEEKFPGKRFAQAYPFEAQGEFARVYLEDSGENAAEASGWALINNRGEYVLTGWQTLNELPDVSTFASGVDANGMAKIIDLSGEDIISLDQSYMDIDSFVSGRYAIAYRDGLAGMVDTGGVTLVQPYYLSIRHYSYDIGIAEIGSVLLVEEPSGLYGILFLNAATSEVAELVPAEYDSISFDNFQQGYLDAVKDGQTGILNLLTMEFCPTD